MNKTSTLEQPYCWRRGIKPQAEMSLVKYSTIELCLHSTQREVNAFWQASTKMEQCKRYDDSLRSWSSSLSWWRCNSTIPPSTMHYLYPMFVMYLYLFQCDPIHGIYLLILTLSHRQEGAQIPLYIVLQAYSGSKHKNHHPACVRGVLYRQHEGHGYPCRSHHYRK